MKFRCLVLKKTVEFSYGLQAINGLGCEKCRNLGRRCPGPEEVPVDPPLREQLKLFGLLGS
jgi:hypothetical protein